MKQKKGFPADLRISLIYVVLGAIWILFSDKVLHSEVTDIAQLNKIEIYKGCFFVVITGLLLYLLIHRTLEHRTKILKELEKAKIKAEESDRLKSAFLYNMSHYLRTPMNSILGFVELLKNRNLDDEKHARFLSIVNEQSNHLLQFINNIIEISKLQGGQIEINIKEFSLNDLLRKIQYRYQTELEFTKRANLIQLKGYYNKDLILKNDSQKIEYIFTNLLSNSIKFTKEGEINFGYQVQKEVIEFFVSDTGCGIPPEKKDLITKTFMLSDPEINDDNLGIGLGLAITNGLVMLLNGRLWLEKSSEKGTEFRFTTPIVLQITQES